MVGGSSRVAGSGISSSSSGRQRGGVNDDHLLVVAVALEKRRQSVGGLTLAACSTYCVKNSALQNGSA